MACCKTSSIVNDADVITWPGVVIVAGSCIF